MDKILRINMGPEAEPKTFAEALGDYAGLGEQALTTAAMSDRISISCKSPLTGTIKASNAGGQGAQVLDRLGYATIVLEGVAQG